MKIAVLMSTYNGEKYLEQQLDSLSKQTVRDKMVVYIRDDGSTDQTISIIEMWTPKMDIVLYKEQNVGPATSFWKLIMKNNIKADYYAFCDQDDIWDNDKLEAAINSLEKNKNIHLYACNCRIIDQKGNIVLHKRKESFPEISIPSLFVTGVTQGCSMVFTDYLRQHIMKMNIRHVPMHDIVLMLYAVQFGQVRLDNTPYFSYRFHDSNVVAKENKTFIKRINTTYRNWKNGAKNSMACVANEMLKNCPQMSADDKEYLIAVADYKFSILNKIKLLSNKQTLRIDKGALRSYRMRIILGLF